MKYNRMLCWVRPFEKRDLIKEAKGEIPLVFAKNFDEFKSSIKGDDFLVMSIVRAVRNLTKMQNVTREFPNNDFYLYYRSNEEGYMTENELELFREKNIVNGQFMPSGLVSSFKE